MKKFYSIFLLLISIQEGKCLIEMGGGILEYGGVTFGGYFDVHEADRSTRRRCGKIRHRSGVIQVEAMRYAVDKINRNNSEILYGLKLGYFILDTCSNTDTIRQMFMTMMFLTRNIGIVGPPRSNEAVFVAALSGILDIPVISPTASSSVLDDRVKYYNIFRAVPSDASQVAAAVKILSRFNWTYVSTVGSFGNNGQRSIELLSSMTAAVGICIARQNILPEFPTRHDYLKVVNSLKSDKKAKVIVLFTSQGDTQELLKEVGSENQFTWLSSSGWPTNNNMSRNFSKAANSSIILQYTEVEDRDFEEYFLNLKLKKNSYSWFKELWSEVFRCSVGSRNDPRPKCTGNESLANSGIQWDFKPAKRIMSAVETFSCVMRKILLKWCPTRNRKCLRSVGSGLLIIRLQVIKFLTSAISTCVGLNDSKKFNEFGYLPEDIKIVRFNGASYKQIGLWKYNETSDSMSLMLSSNDSWNGERIPLSVCSLPCKLGEVMMGVQAAPKCCFACKLCPNNNIVSNNTCKSCGRYEAASQDYSKCNELPRVHISLIEKRSWPTVTCSAIGICLNTLFLGLFVKHRESRVVKASSRELSFVIFLALYACFASPFAFLASPSRLICGTQRLTVGMSLTGCYTPLMLKTNRIYRIFKASELLRFKPPLVSPKSQMLICLCLLGMQLLLGVMWLVGDPPEVAKKLIENGSQVAEICKYDSTFIIFLNLIPCFFLMAISTIYAFRTRKFPSNFNEAHSTGITMYISCFLWGIFIPLTMLLKITNDNVFLLTYVVANFTVIIGFVTLIGLFGPKLKKLLCLDDTVSVQERFHEVQHPAASSQMNATKSTCEDDKSAVGPRIVTKDVGTNT